MATHHRRLTRIPLLLCVFAAFTMSAVIPVVALGSSHNGLVRAHGELASPCVQPAAHTRIYLPIVVKIWAPPVPVSVILTVRDTASVARSGEPVTSGVPIPQSAGLTNLDRLRLLDGGGRPVPAQFTALARWGGAATDSTRPLRWILVDLQATVGAGGSTQYRLVDTGGASATPPTLRITDGASAVTIDTGVAQFSISRSNGNLTGPWLTAPVSGSARDTGGTTYTSTGAVDVSVVLNGPLRAVVHVKGAYRSSGGAVLVNYTSRYWFYAGKSTVRLFHTVENNRLCPLGDSEQLECFAIGSGGSVEVTDLSLIVPTNLGGSLSYQVGGQGIPVSGNLTGNLLLRQDSSGTDHWNLYPTFTDWEGAPVDTRPRMQSYVTFRGYRTTLGGATVDSGNQAAGWLSVTGSRGTWTVGVQDFWQNFPKTLRAGTNGVMQVGLFPDEYGPAGYAFSLRAGEHKTHEVWLTAPPGSVAPTLPALFAQAPAQWYVDSGGLGLAAVRNWSDWGEYEQYIDYQLDTSPEHAGHDDLFNNLPDAIERTDMYGIFDYGDWPVDYEGYRVAPHNSKYDYDLGMWVQWARGGGQRWFGLAEAAGRHIADVDILHNLHAPRHWGDGIVFGHSGHDEAGFTNPHRNENSGNPDVAFGMLGMLATYYLTGYEKAYESALELADCLEYRLHNDVHLCDQFPAGTCNGNGWALQGDGLYGIEEGGWEAQGEGTRAAANSLSMVVAAYRATGDTRYLTVADALVNWARPAEQPYIHGVTGGNEFMRPWMLNLYLRALATYLEMRKQFGLPDAYGARDSYLTWANWLHTYAWIDLSPIDTGVRAAYPYQWWCDGRDNVPDQDWDQDNDNRDPSINNFLLLGADTMAYAYHLTGQSSYLDWATRLFRTGVRDPWFEGDLSMYTESKQTMNHITFGQTFLLKWAKR